MLNSRKKARNFSFHDIIISKAKINIIDTLLLIASYCKYLNLCLKSTIRRSFNLKWYFIKIQEIVNLQGQFSNYKTQHGHILLKTWCV